jgi:nitrite reductase/ring-hydroxylating ferredoxin subunit
MSERLRLCRLDDVPEDGTNGFLVESGRGRFGAMVIRRAGKIFVYVNSCPHVGAPLDIRAGQFLNVERSHIICSTHGALFRIDDGYCVSGPCAGAHLIPLAHDLDGDDVFVTIPEREA